MDTTRIDLQNREFDSLVALNKAYERMSRTAVVDDDYPEMRHYYHSALRTFLEACKANGSLA